jgi:hypothetical protein
MRKKVFLFALCLWAGALSVLFAQQTPEAVLSQGKLKNLIDNWSEISNIMSNAASSDSETGVMESALLRYMASLAQYFDPDTGLTTDDQEYRDAFAALRQVKTPKPAAAQFSKYGLIPSGCEIVWVCTIGYMLLRMEEQVNTGLSSLAEDADESVPPELLQDFPRRFKVLKSVIHPADLRLIQQNRDQLVNVLGDI